MGRNVLSLVVAAAAALGATAPAAAQTQACSARSEVIKHLSGEFAEAPVAMGLANNGGVVEILSSNSGQSWTIIVTLPNGVSCLIAAGENWETLPVLSARDPNA